MGGGVRRNTIFVMKMRLGHTYEELVNMESLLDAWQEFLRGKRNKNDVQEFQLHLMDNILSLHGDLINENYRHGDYYCFTINDPKLRIIHKALVRDRLLHHAVYRTLYPFFDRRFTSDSFSCRNNKGMHKAINRFREFGRIVSKNNTKTCWVLKCDIKKFFASIDQMTLIKLLDDRIKDKKIVSLLKEVITSFHSGKQGIGLPLGNLTSQLFSNVYMNEFDQFIKQSLKVKYYIRYADDFVMFSEDKGYLENLIPQIKEFLETKLKLTLHPDKIHIKTLYSGVDFLGWVHFPHHRVIRKATQRRMFKKMKNNSKIESLNAYLGLISHGNSYKIKEKLLKIYYESQK